MYRKNQHSKVQRNVESSDSSDSSSSSSVDHDDTTRLKTASDLINSFLNRNETIPIERTNVPKLRNASDVINSFLRKKTTPTQTNRAPFQSASDLINSFLQNDKTWGDTATSKRKRTNRNTIDSSTSDSGSSTDGNAAKRRRIESSHRTKSVKHSSNKDQPSSATSNTNISNDELATSSSCAINLIEDNVQRTQLPVEESRPSVQNNPSKCPVRRSTRLQTTSQSNLSSKKQKKKSNYIPVAKHRIVIRREIRDKKDKTKKSTKTYLAKLKEYRIPKPKYDRALEILDSVESRFDETPVDYNAHLPNKDQRRNCEQRRYSEAVYDHSKLTKFQQISASRVICEMENCLQKENWQQMAKLIYFGCDTLLVEDTRSDRGTTFLTYALLLLLLDSNPSQLSSFEDKRNTLMKYFKALANESHQIDEYLKELKFTTEELDNISTDESRLEQSQQI